MIQSVYLEPVRSLDAYVFSMLHIVDISLCFCQETKLVGSTMQLLMKKASFVSVLIRLNSRVMHADGVSKK